MQHPVSRPESPEARRTVIRTAGSVLRHRWRLVAQALLMPLVLLTAFSNGYAAAAPPASGHARWKVAHGSAHVPAVKTASEEVVPASGTVRAPGRLAPGQSGPGASSHEKGQAGPAGRSGHAPSAQAPIVTAPVQGAFSAF